MREKTKKYSEEAKKDFNCMRPNNSKWNKRTKEERLQSVNARYAFYYAKWKKLFGESETTVQECICMDMLEKINHDTVILRSLVGVERRE